MPTNWCVLPPPPIPLLLKSIYFKKKFLNQIFLLYVLSPYCTLHPPLLWGPFKGPRRVLFRKREVVHNSHFNRSGVLSPLAALGSISPSLPAVSAWGVFWCILCPVPGTSDSVSRALQPELLIWAHTVQCFYPISHPLSASVFRKSLAFV